MSDHHHHQHQHHPRLHHLRSTPQLLRQASASFFSNLLTFLFLSLLIFSFRTVVENGTHLLTAFIDRDPSLKSLLSRLDLAANPTSSSRSPHPSPVTLRRRRRPFLHLTRVGTLDEDFFSGEDDDDSRALFGSTRKAPIFIFSHFTSKLGFNGTRVSDMARSGLSFKADQFTISNEKATHRDGGDNEEEEEEEEEKGNSETSEMDRIVDLQFFIKGLELGQRDVAALFFLVSFLSAAYGWVILGFLVTYSWVLGIVFTTVVNDLIGRFNSFIGLVWDGSRLGVKRLSGFILMRWAVRDALTQLLGLWYFGEIEDQYSFFKLFIRLKLMPFSVMPPWIRGFEKEISGFLLMWIFVDTIVAFVFAVDAWIAIVDSRKSGKEIVKEGLQLVGSMFSQALQIKCLELIFCGTSVKWGLTRVFGRSFAKVFQSTMEVYFLVAWLIFYFAGHSITNSQLFYLSLWQSENSSEKSKMPGVTGPSDYSREPPRHTSLKINAKEPFNAEPPRSALGAAYVTPVEFFYKRNHGPIPVVDDIHSYSVSITGLIENPKQLFLNDIKALPKYNVTATLQCAGNRRTAMSQTRTVKGVGWDVSAIGNAVWGGAKLADVLELVGIPKLTGATKSGGKHVEFVSVDRCKEENGGPYKASIPLIQATNPEADVLLAYEMNGETLNRDHGYPLRGVVPGVIGARSVKWLDSINVIAEECQGFFMQKDYKMFPPSVNWDNINWSTRRPQMDFPVQCVICSLEDVNAIKPGKVKVSGYATSGGGRAIERVDVSVDGGNTWVEASRHQKTGIPYIAEAACSDKWAWVLFEAMVDVQQSTQIVAKAVDSAANVQPEKVEDIWNLRGILNTSWHRVQVRVGHSNL